MPATKPRAYQVYDIDWKQAVRALSDSNINLTSPGALVIDTVVLDPYDRVLLTAQTNATQNGIYQVNAAQTLLVPAPDWININSGLSSAVNSGLTVTVTEGADYAQTTWTLTTPNPIVIGVTAIVFEQVPEASDRISNIYFDGSIIELANSVPETDISILPGGAGSDVGIVIPTDATANVDDLHIFNLATNGNVKISTDGGDWRYDTAGNFTGNGNVQAGYFLGNGALLTGISAGSSYSNANAAAYAASGWGGNIIPNANAVYSLGNVTNQWGNLWVANNTIYLGNVPLAIGAGNVLTVNGNAVLQNNSNSTISTTGNITANYFVGNGSQLTGLAATYGNANVVANLAALGSNPISTTGNITANYFVGNGSQLTGIVSSYGNANVANYLPTFSGNISAGNVSASGNVTANYFVGLSGNITNLDSLNFTVENISARIGNNGVNIGAGGYNNLVVLPTEVLIQNVPLKVAGNIVANETNGLYITANAPVGGTARIWNFDIDGNLTVAGNIQTISTGFQFSSNISGINTGSPTVIVTLTGSVFGAIETGQVTISGVVGTTQANGTWYYASIDPSNFVLYNDAALTNPVNGNTWTAYSSGGIAVSPGYSNISITAGNVSLVTGTGNTWLFGTDGRLTFPGTPRIDTNSDNFEVQAAESINLEANAVVNIYTDTSGTAYQWQFGDDGNLNLPNGGSIIVDGGDGAIGPVSDDMVISWDNEELILRSVGGDVDVEADNDFNIRVNYDGGATDYLTKWVFGQNNEIVNITGNSAIVTEAGNLNLQGGRNTLSSGNVQITAVNNGVAINTWTFDNTGNLTAPGNLIFANNYVYSGNTFKSPNSTVGNLNAFAWQFSDNSIGNDTITLQWNLFDTTTSQWYLSTDSQTNAWTLDSATKKFSYSALNASPGSALTFGNAAANGTGAVNDIELTSSDSNVYIRANSSSWQFDNDGTLSAPGNITTTGNVSAAYLVVSGGIRATGASPAPTLSGFSSISTVGATGNITASGTLIANVGITTVGNVTGNYFIGNGSQLTGIAASYGNAEVATFLGAYGSNTVSTTGNITSGNLITGGRVVATGNIVTGGQLQSSAFTGGNISWSANNQTDFQGQIKVGGTGRLLSPGGAASITLNNNGANIPTLGVTIGTAATSTTTGALIVTGGAGLTGNIYVGGIANIAGNVNGSGATFSGNVTAQNLIGNISITGNVTGTSSNVTLVAGSYNWTFDNTGNFTLPGNTFSVNYANNTPVDVVTRFEGSWTVPVGNSTQSFTVNPNETYYMWVDCNIPNGILTWNATATVTNTNVSVVGAQYAWVYSGGGTPIDFTSIPNQFVGTANTIIRSSVAPSATTNRFDFGINNTSGNTVTVRYGWVQIS